MILLPVFLAIMNQNKLSVWFIINKMKNCHYDHIPFNLKGITNLFSTKSRDKFARSEINFSRKMKTFYRVLLVAFFFFKSYTETFLASFCTSNPTVSGAIFTRIGIIILAESPVML